MVKKFKNKNEGFTLIELMIGMFIISLVAVSTIKYLSTQAENKRADNAGLQMAEAGRALGHYISRESAALNSCLSPGGSPIELPVSAMRNSTGQVNVGSCVLANRQFLPVEFSNNNIFGFDYKYYIKKSASGTLHGLVLSDNPVVDRADSASGPKYDWLGRAMRAAGPQAGITFVATGANSLRGLGGGWALASSEYPAINKLGLLGYRVSYTDNLDDIYLRLDGAYPMRGNLNMGNYSINNITDINYNGWLNGNNALINNIKSGYISNAGSIVTDSLQSEKAITMADLHRNNKPSGSVFGDKAWDGSKAYIHTWNLYSEGMIATGNNGEINAYMDASGLIGARDIYIDNTSGVMGKDNVKVKGFLTDRLPSYVNKGAVVVRNNETVTKPNCTAAGGRSKARIVVIPQVFNTYGNYDVKVRVSANGKGEIFTETRRTPYTSDQVQVYAVNAPNYWVIKIESYTANTVGKGASNGHVALAMTYCDFN